MAGPAKRGSSKAPPAGSRAVERPSTRQREQEEKRAVEEEAEAAASREGHSEFELSNEEIEQALRTGDHAGLLEDYFGPQDYRQLRQLAREASASTMRGGPPVLILPGIMGSKLGRRGKGIFDDTLWFDPVDVTVGGLAALALPPRGRAALEPLGVMLMSYLKLKLRLQATGFDVEFHPFDWRRSIAELGAELAERLETLGGARVSLVAHCMGGLVARWALGNGAECRRLIMLGTPNHGCFAPVQAMRGTYPVLRKVAALDQKHTAEALARDVFSTFPGLTQMLPSPEKFSAVALYDPGSWPRPAQGGDDGLRPRDALLAEVAAVREGLAPGDSRFVLIAGVDQRTVVGLVRDEQHGFLYEMSLKGDGTVPLEMARLADVPTYYIPESHGSLPNHRLVGRAVADLLMRDTTDALPRTYANEERRGTPNRVPEEVLRVDPYAGRRGALLSQRELREMLEEVASPTAHDEPKGTVAADGVEMTSKGQQEGFHHSFDRIVVGRRRQHRIDLRFALGSITEADARAIALGIFRDVTPSGAATAIDRRLGGALTELSRRRMYTGNVGEVFMLPTGRNPIPADLVALVGLGPFDRFNEEVLEVAAENIVRTFVQTRVEEFATVLFGAGSGERPAAALRGLLGGFIRGLLDADRDHHFRRIIICEWDPQRYTELKEELYRLSSTSLCADLEFTFDEVTLPQPLEPTGGLRTAQPVRQDPVYLIVRQEPSVDTAETFNVRSSVLTAGAKATVVTGVRTVSTDKFNELREHVTSPYTSMEDMEDGGGELARLVLADGVRAVLPRQRDRHLVVVHDAPMSRVPWETLALDQPGEERWLPAALHGLTHRYAADNLSVAKWLEERLLDEVLNVLLVVNPTADLEGAEKEGERVRALFGKLPGCRVSVMHQSDATRPALLQAFSSGEYDVLHYAGHAFFEEETPEATGLLCHGHVPLTGADLSGVGKLPAFVFFNACESGRLRGGAGRKAARKPTAKKGGKSASGSKQTTSAPPSQEGSATGVAEAFLRGGVANFLGTYWEVGDDPAMIFADAFYARVIAGGALGQAIQDGRLAVRETVSRDWADYMFYGNHDFVLKEAIGRRARARE